MDEEAVSGQWFQAVRQAYLMEVGEPLEPERLNNAMKMAVESFAPSPFRSILWQLSQNDEALYKRMKNTFREHVGPYTDELRPGIRELLLELSERVPMAVVANQKRGLEERLKTMGIRHCFQHINGSEDVRLWKPDIRIFERALAELGVEAEHVAMIGDRQDNDITPAKTLGMTAILFKTGTHTNQRFRYPEEKPDAVVHSVEELRDLLFSLTDHTVS